MPLLTLPNELLSLVGDFVCDEADLIAFTKAHPKLRGVLEHSLYRLAAAQYPESTPLHWAAAKDDVPMAKRALGVAREPRSALNATDDRGRTALWVAADEGHVAMLSFLLGVDGLDVDVEARSGGNMWNAFFQACWRRRGEALEVLIRSGRFDLNARCSTGWTPLQKSVLGQRRRSVRVLLDSGQVDVNVRGRWDNTPFDSIGRSDAMGVRLLEAGLDPTAVHPTTGRTPLHRAAMCYLPHTLTMLLGSKGVDVNARDVDGRTPLHQACRTPDAHWPTLVPLLLKAPGIILDPQAKDGRTPLQIALEWQHEDSAKALGYEAPVVTSPPDGQRKPRHPKKQRRPRHARGKQRCAIG